MTEPLNLEEYEGAARALLPAMAFDYVAAGADDETTVRRNRQGFERYLLVPRVLAASGVPDLTTTVLGTPVSLPVLLAPAAFQGLLHPEGELASARAASAAGTIMVASTFSNHSLEAIAEAATGPLWFQLYVYRNRRLTESLVRRAEAAGYAALCLTGDTPVIGRRERDIRNSFVLPAGVTIANMVDAPALAGLSPAEGSSLAAYAAAELDPSLGWDVIDWLRSIASLPIIVKGVMSAADARLAVEHGVDAIVVSNHGGRQLDSAPSTIEVLSEVVDAVQGNCEVYLDGGVRRGTDVLKALGLGARGVMIGRPYLWGLAVDGEQGVRRVLELLAAELAMDLMLCGCGSVSTVRPEILRRAE